MGGCGSTSNETIMEKILDLEVKLDAQHNQANDTAQSVIQNSVSQRPQSEPLLLETANFGETKETLSIVYDSIEPYSRVWRRNRVEIGKHVQYIFELSIGEWQDTLAESLSHMNDLHQCLERAIAMAQLFESDMSAAWAIIPMQRLVAQVLCKMSFYMVGAIAAENDNHPQQQQQQQQPQQQKPTIAPAVLEKWSKTADKLLNTDRTTLCCDTQLHEVAKFFKALLTDHTAQLMGALGLTVLGAVKSVLLMKVDADLIKGIGKGMSAGFDLYKHYKADEQFLLLFRVTSEPYNKIIPKLRVPGALKDKTQFVSTYEELVKTSKLMANVDGNWFLKTNYVEMMLRLAMASLKGIDLNNSAPVFSDTDSVSRQLDPLVSIISACVLGDDNVLGITTVVKKLGRKRKAGSKTKANGMGSGILLDFVNSFCDGESVACFLRESVSEAVGELTESVEHMITDRITELQDQCREASVEWTEELWSAELGIKQDALRHIEAILESLGYVSDVRFLFMKSLKKSIGHIAAICKSIDMMLSFGLLLKMDAVSPEEKEAFQKKYQAGEDGTNSIYDLTLDEIVTDLGDELAEQEMQHIPGVSAFGELTDLFSYQAEELKSSFEGALGSTVDSHISSLNDSRIALCSLVCGDLVGESLNAASNLSVTTQAVIQKASNYVNNTSQPLQDAKNTLTTIIATTAVISEGIATACKIPILSSQLSGISEVVDTTKLMAEKLTTTLDTVSSFHKFVYSSLNTFSNSLAAIGTGNDVVSGWEHYLTTLTDIRNEKKRIYKAQLDFTLSKALAGGTLYTEQFEAAKACALALRDVVMAQNELSAIDQEVLRKGGQIGDDFSLQFCLQWSGADLDMYLKLPDSTTCCYSTSTLPCAKLDVDMRGGSNQIENIHVDLMKAPTGRYNLYIDNYSGSEDTNYTVTMNAMGVKTTTSGIVRSDEKNSNKSYVMSFDFEGRQKMVEHREAKQKALEESVAKLVAACRALKRSMQQNQENGEFIKKSTEYLNVPFETVTASGITKDLFNNVDERINIADAAMLQFSREIEGQKGMAQQIYDEKISLIEEISWQDFESRDYEKLIEVPLFYILHQMCVASNKIANSVDIEFIQSDKKNLLQECCAVIESANVADVLCIPDIAAIRAFGEELVTKRDPVAMKKFVYGGTSEPASPSSKCIHAAMEKICEIPSIYINKILNKLEDNVNNAITNAITDDTFMKPLRDHLNVIPKKEVCCAFLLLEQIKESLETNNTHLVALMNAFKSIPSTDSIKNELEAFQKRLRGVIDNDLVEQNNTESGKPKPGAAWKLINSATSNLKQLGASIKMFGPYKINPNLLENIEDLLSPLLNLVSVDKMTANFKVSGDVLRLASQVFGYVENMFYDLAQVKDMSNLWDVIGHSSVIKDPRDMGEEEQHKVAETIMSTSGFEDTMEKAVIRLGSLPGTGWWKTVSGQVGECLGTDAMVMVRQGMKTLMGPGERPELIEECSIAALLDFDLYLRSFIMAAREGCAEGATESHPLVEELSVLSEAIGERIARSRASSNCTNLKQLFEQDQYRAAVQDAVRANWQLIETSVVDDHIEAMRDQEVLKKLMNNLAVDTMTHESSSKSVDELSHTVENSHIRHAFLDSVPHLLSCSGTEESINSTMIAAKDLQEGAVGLSGLAPSLMLRLEKMQQVLAVSKAEILKAAGLADTRKQGWMMNTSYEEDDEYFDGLIVVGNFENTTYVPRWDREREGAIISPLNWTAMEPEDLANNHLQVQVAVASDLDIFKEELGRLQNKLNLELERLRNKMNSLDDTMCRLLDLNRTEMGNGLDTLRSGLTEKYVAVINENTAIQKACTIAATDATNEKIESLGNNIIAETEKKLDIVEKMVEVISEAQKEADKKRSEYQNNLTQAAAQNVLVLGNKMDFLEQYINSHMGGKKTSRDGKPNDTHTVVRFRNVVDHLMSSLSAGHAKSFLDEASLSELMAQLALMSNRCDLLTLLETLQHTLMGLRNILLPMSANNTTTPSSEPNTHQSCITVIQDTLETLSTSLQTPLLRKHIEQMQSILHHLTTHLSSSVAGDAHAEASGDTDIIAMKHWNDLNDNVTALVTGVSHSPESDKSNTAHTFQNILNMLQAHDTSSVDPAEVSALADLQHQLLKLHDAFENTTLETGVESRDESSSSEIDEAGGDNHFNVSTMNKRIHALQQLFIAHQSRILEEFGKLRETGPLETLDLSNIDSKVQGLSHALDQMVETNSNAFNTLERLLLSMQSGDVTGEGEGKGNSHAGGNITNQDIHQDITTFSQGTTNAFVTIQNMLASLGIPNPNDDKAATTTAGTGLIPTPQFKFILDEIETLTFSTDTQFATIKSLLATQLSDFKNIIEELQNNIRSKGGDALGEFPATKKKPPARPSTGGFMRGMSRDRVSPSHLDTSDSTTFRPDSPSRSPNPTFSKAERFPSSPGENELLIKL